MSSWLATAAGIAFLKPKQDTIAPYKQVVEHVEAQQQQAIKDLEDATERLIQAVAEKLPK